jgi:hypothetical protein
VKRRDQKKLPAKDNQIAFLQDQNKNKDDQIAFLQDQNKNMVVIIKFIANLNTQFYKNFIYK